MEARRTQETRCPALKQSGREAIFQGTAGERRPAGGGHRTRALGGVQGGRVQLAEEGLRAQGHCGADTAERQRLHADTHVPVGNQGCKGTTWVSPSASKQQTLSFQKSKTRFPEAAARPSRQSVQPPLTLTSLG